MRFKFLASQPIKENVISFAFEPEQPLNWQPGQYFHYVLPHPNADERGTERWFTNSAAPVEKHVTISTRIDSEHGSSFKRALQGLKPGDEVEANGPEGDFTVQDFTRNYIFVAGGIGITPFRSILVEANAKHQPIHATLLYANRTEAVPFSEELQQIAQNNPNFKIEYILQPQRIDGDLLKKYIEATDNPFVYISGPEPMVKSFAEQLEAIGLSKDNIKLDDFPGYEAD